MRAGPNLRPTAAPESAASAENESLPGEFFGGMRAGWQRASDAVPVVCRDIHLGPTRVRVRIAGPRLADQYLRALGHVAREPAARQADAEILVWDAKGSASPAPSPRWADTDQVFRGEIARLCNDRIRTAYNIESRVLNVADRECGVGIQCVQEPCGLPQYELGAPFRELMSWLLLRHDAQLLHAGAVGDSSGGLLLVGRGGSGKSNSAAACVGSDLAFAADDYCVAHLGDTGPTISSLYSTLKLGVADDEHLPTIRRLPSALCERTGKFLYYLGEQMPQALVVGFPLRAIVLPFVGGGPRTLVRPVSAARGMRALAPSTLLQLPGSGRGTLDLLGQLVRSVPNFEMELGSDREGVVSALEDLLAAQR